MNLAPQFLISPSQSHWRVVNKNTSARIPTKNTTSQPRPSPSPPLPRPAARAETPASRRSGRSSLPPRARRATPGAAPAHDRGARGISPRELLALHVGGDCSTFVLLAFQVRRNSIGCSRCLMRIYGTQSLFKAS